MTKEEKNKIKDMLKEWGRFAANMRAQNSAFAEFKRMCVDIERASLSGGKCEVIPVEVLRRRAKKLGLDLTRRVSRKSGMDEIINDMPYDIQCVLRARYVKRLAWEVIPANLPFYMSVRQCYRLHDKAIEIIADKYRPTDDDIDNDIC